MLLNICSFRIIELGESIVSIYLKIRRQVGLFASFDLNIGFQTYEFLIEFEIKAYKYGDSCSHGFVNGDVLSIEIRQVQLHVKLLF